MGKLVMFIFALASAIMSCLHLVSKAIEGNDIAAFQLLLTLLFASIPSVYCIKSSFLPNSSASRRVKALYLGQGLSCQVHGEECKSLSVLSITLHEETFRHITHIRQHQGLSTPTPPEC